MKPLNLDNSPCSPVSSNCVIWAGPNIPCIKLCTGDTISDVTFKLATELCTILDYLNVQNYDLTCFNLAACGPNNYQELIQFLIDRICAIENVPANVATTTSTAINTKSPDVSNYLMTAQPCFGGGTVTLVDYVQQAATQICNIFVQINIINSGIDSLNTRVTTLENAPVPSFVIPSFILSCDIGTIIPVLASGSTQDIDVVISRFINEEWCPYKATFGSYSDLATSILAQCILGTDNSEALKYTSPGTQMQVAYPAYVASPTTLADAINNLWIALCDVRNAGTALTDVVAGDNITVTPVTSIVGSDELTTYTISGKEAIVVGTDDIVVTPVTVGNDTTYTVGRTAKINFYDEVIVPVDIVTDPSFINNTYFSPTAYTGLTYTNTSGVSKDFYVNVSYDTFAEYVGVPAIQTFLSNKVDGAIVKGVSTVIYESLGTVDLAYSLWDTVTNLEVTGSTAETVVTTPGVNPVEVGVGRNSYLPKNTSFFTKVTLAAGETITLKFKSTTGLIGNLSKAQMFVQEL